MFLWTGPREISWGGGDDAERVLRGRFPGEGLRSLVEEAYLQGHL